MFLGDTYSTVGLYFLLGVFTPNASYVLEVFVGVFMTSVFDSLFRLRLGIVAVSFPFVSDDAVALL